MKMSSWSKGDRVIWRAEASHSLVSTLPGVVTQVTPSGVTIAVLYRLGDQWVKESRNVTPASLFQRKRFINGLDDRR